MNHDAYSSSNIYTFKCNNNSIIISVYCMLLVLGFEVDKPSKILIKTLNAVEYIESDVQHIEAPRTDDPLN